MKSTRYGDVMAAISFLIWGLLPLYYHFLPNAATDELLALRLIASVPVGLLIIVVIQGRLPNWSAIFSDKRSLLFSFLASAMMSISWYSFTWALTNEQVMEASLGFFISPLVFVALGVVALKEKLSTGKKLGVFFAALGISYQVYQYGHAPYIAISMAVFFALYGLCKKYIRYSWSTALFMEALLLTPVALGYMIYKSYTVGSVALTSNYDVFLLYLGAAPITLLPLVFYSLAIKYTSLTNVGLMQYIEPSLQFVLAVLLFGEMFDEVKVVSFGLIWFGLAMTLIETLCVRYKQRSLRKANQE
ncbi:EamA family transporter RarD [Vibrio tapetis subsp. quintayensis]|uniref:EamA family transporter RarD n=1 Tax=Vibrio tapetis TaxID=52443 RepID=UPI0025B61E4B|nr:EamA family transporter RarD [Vibrio tapetis]MDN3681158.1 EamA family transporter RarD [Vibrio tapetis subsp. quintayensis]